MAEKNKSSRAAKAASNAGKKNAAASKKNQRNMKRHSFPPMQFLLWSVLRCSCCFLSSR